MKKDTKATIEAIPDATIGLLHSPEINVRIQIINIYTKYVAEHGTTPKTAYALAQLAGINEAEFYQYFSSVDAVDEGVWAFYMETAVAEAKAEAESAQYRTVRERLLSLYFNIFTVFNANRSFALASIQHFPTKRLHFTPNSLIIASKVFKVYVTQLIVKGTEAGEVVNRPIVGQKYADLLWLKTLAIIAFWRYDKSPGFEDTDVAIEKAVNIGLDLMGQNGLDNVLDLAKFLWQRKA